MVTQSAIPAPIPNDITWPFFKIDTNSQIKSFWTRRSHYDHDKFWVKNQQSLLFSGSMLRVGRKKKGVKGYFFKINSSGLLMYFKKVDFNYCQYLGS
jgi:hypothetical protein